MSHFKLDFDISNVPAVPPKRRRIHEFKKQTESTPILPVVVKPPEPVEESKSAVSLHHYLSKFWTDRHFKLCIRSVVVLAFVLSVVAIALFEGATYVHKEEAFFGGSCERRRDYLLCHGARGCKVRGNCHFSRLIRLSSARCADRIQTITTHSPLGDPTQYPAHYLRYKNTSAYIVEGDRVLLHPVHDHSCKAFVQSLPDNQFSSEVLSQLQGSVIWTSEAYFDSFLVQRDGHTVATIEEEVALFTSTDYYRLYKLDIVCSSKHSGKITVFGQEEATKAKKEINAFDFC